MRYFYLFFTLVLLFSCQESEESPVLPEDYGNGLYIGTSNGVSFYDGVTVHNQIYRSVNNISLSNVDKIKFKGTKVYILAENLYTANVKTFEDKGSVSSFVNPVDFDFVGPDDRLFVVDKGDSKVKVVDLNIMEITSDIETGDSTRPVFIVSNSSKSFILNGGGLSNEEKDSTVVVIEYRDNIVPLANFIGSLPIGDNPNSAIIRSAGHLNVLCKGVYDPTNSINNTESAVANINQYTNEIYSIDNLSGVYNAQNLIWNWDNTSTYLTAEGGIYRLSLNSLNVNLIVGVNASIINTNNESYADTDTTIAYSEMLYMNDIYSPNTVYKYNFNLSSFVDTIVVDGDVRDINFYNAL